MLVHGCSSKTVGSHGNSAEARLTYWLISLTFKEGPLKTLATLLLLATVGFADDLSKQREIANQFCGAPARIRAGGSIILIQCPQEKGGLSARVEGGTLVTIYPNRTPPAGIDKIEVVKPDDERWKRWTRSCESCKSMELMFPGHPSS